MNPAHDLRRRGEQRDALLLQRLEAIVPALMRRHGLDCWVVVGREYMEDPVLMTMLPSSWLSGRRRTILVWFDDGTKHQRFAVSRYAVGDAFPGAWNPDEEPDQWRALAALVARHDPVRIGVSMSRDFALSDGLTATEHEQLTAALGSELAPRLVSSQPLTVGWLETRLPKERLLYEAACATAHEILRRDLSFEAIYPGRTTTEDLVWWYRQAVVDAGFDSWFQPTVSVQRRGVAPGSFADRPDAIVIDPGDLVHVDFGIVMHDLCTDHQEHLYVLAPGETAPAAGLAKAMAAGLRQQDAVLEAFAAGRSGNEVLAISRAVAERSGIDAAIYSHPIGYHGHAAGPTIGLWDQQDGVPGTGDHRIAPNTAYSIELSVQMSIAEWDGQPVRIMLEQDVWFDGVRCEFMDGRQEELWVLG